MEKWVIPIVEGIALLVCLIFVTLWIDNPQGPYEPTFAASGLIFIITELYRRYVGSKSQDNNLHCKLDFDTKNTVITRLINKHNIKNGNIGIAFYVIKIVNISNKSYTIKDVILRYDFDNVNYSTISYVLLTGTIYAPLDKKDKDSIIIHKGEDNLVLMGWNNLRTEIGKYKTLNPGDILSGSAFFILEFDDIDKAKNLKNVEIVIADYSGRESVHPVDIKEEWINMGRDTFIHPRPFHNNEEKVEFSE